MNRQQRRAMEKKGDRFISLSECRKEREPTYVFTESQLKKAINDSVKDVLETKMDDIVNDMMNTTMALLLTIPLEVLMDHYWTKSYGKRIPEFTKHVLEYYERWQNGELDMDKLKEDLWEYGGVRLEAEK